MVEDNGWNFNTLMKYMNQRFVAMEAAVKKTDEAVDQRFTSVNEFRGALNDLSNNMLTRSQFEVQHAALADRVSLQDRRIEALQLQLAELSARASGQKQGFGLIGSVILAIIAAASPIVLILNFLARHP